MVSLLTTRVVDRGFEPDRVKAKTIKLVIVANSANIYISTHHSGVRAKTGWLGIMIICLSEATCRSVDCCVSELALQKLMCWSSTTQTSLSNVTCSRHDIVEKFADLS